MSATLQPVIDRRAPGRVWWRWAVVLVPGVLLYFFTLPGLNTAQGRLFAIFAATIIALVAQPVRMGVSVLLAMTLLALTGTLTPARVLAGFGNITVWLVFTAFLFSRAVTQTGFGTRVGYQFIARFGRTPLRLGYSLAAADLVLGALHPVGHGTRRRCRLPHHPFASPAPSAPSPGPTARKIGAFLVLVSFHTTYAASAMFLTGMAANPLIAEFARKIGHVELTWGRWLLGSIVPGFLTLSIVPWLLFRLVRPEIRHTEEARAMARGELARRGPMERQERWLVAIMLGVMAGWVTFALARRIEYLRGAQRTLRAAVDSSDLVGRPVGRAPRLGCPDLVRAARHDVRCAERERRHQGVERRIILGNAWLGMAARHGGAGRGLLLCPLWLRQHDGPRHGALSGVPGGHARRRCTSSYGSIGTGVLL